MWTRYSAEANKKHISTIGTALDGCWAHPSPRVRVWSTSSPTHAARTGGHILMGRRVALMSDILVVSGFKLVRELSAEYY